MEERRHGLHRWSKYLDNRLSVGNVVLALVIAVGWFVDIRVTQQQFDSHVASYAEHRSNYQELKTVVEKTATQSDINASQIGSLENRIGRAEDRNAEQYNEIIRRQEQTQQRVDELVRMLRDQ